MSTFKLMSPTSLYTLTLFVLISLVFRLAIDLGVPIVSVPQLMENAAIKNSDNPDFAHPFFGKVAEIIRSGDK